MRIQVFSQYYKLAQAGWVKPLACPMHQDEPDLTYELIHQDENDKVVLHCLVCGYKNVAGQQLYENIIKIMEDMKHVIV
jgi:hypothetical protein